MNKISQIKRHQDIISIGGAIRGWNSGGMSNTIIVIIIVLVFLAIQVGPIAGSFNLSNGLAASRAFTAHAMETLRP